MTQSYEGNCPDSDLLDGAFESRIDLEDANTITAQMFLADDFEDGVQEIELDFTSENNPSSLPDRFEKIIQAMPSKSLSAHINQTTRKENNERPKVAILKGLDEKAQTVLKSPGLSEIAPNPAALKSVDFIATGKNQEQKQVAPPTPSKDTPPQRGRDFLPFQGSTDGRELDVFQGVLHDLPDQSGMPGFQRVTFVSHDSFSGDLADLEIPNYECHEGVVLPGGHMIIGRWFYEWYPGEAKMSGPFIMWRSE